MASLNTLYIKAETLETILQTIKKKSEKGIELTISINDQANDYGQNVGAFVSQSKEARESGVKKFYVGNGKTFWTDGKIAVVKNESKPQQKAQTNNLDETDLPF